MNIGICSGPADAARWQTAGYDFIEVNVQGPLKPLAPDAEFAPELAAIRAAALPARAANCFIPGNLKITGPQVDFATLTRYVTTAMARAEAAGIRTIVFGSGGARAIPDGFDRAAAYRQLLDFGRMVGPLAAPHGVTVVVEPLNRAECNVFNDLSECAAYVREVNHPNVQLLVDSFHWAKENNTVQDILAAGPLLRHVHIATYRTRIFPGAEECDFRPFLQALRTIGYTGDISLEPIAAPPDGNGAQALQLLRGLTAP